MRLGIDDDNVIHQFKWKLHPNEYMNIKKETRELFPFFFAAEQAKFLSFSNWVILSYYLQIRKHGRPDQFSS